MSSHLTDAEREALDEAIHAAMSHVTPRPDPDTMWDYLMDTVAAHVNGILSARLAVERTKALREVRLAWQWGGWSAITKPSKTPDQMRRVFAVAQAVTDWLIERESRAEADHDRDSG